MASASVIWRKNIAVSHTLYNFTDNFLPLRVVNLRYSILGISCMAHVIVIDIDMASHVMCYVIQALHHETDDTCSRGDASLTFVVWHLRPTTVSLCQPYSIRAYLYRLHVIQWRCLHSCSKQRPPQYVCFCRFCFHVGNQVGTSTTNEIPESDHRLESDTPVVV